MTGFGRGKYENEGRTYTVEIKSVNQISSAHEMQLVNYLTITGINNGLLINFGNLEKLEVKRKYRLYKPKH